MKFEEREKTNPEVLKSGKLLLVYFHAYLKFVVIWCIFF